MCQSQIPFDVDLKVWKLSMGKVIETPFPFTDKGSEVLLLRLTTCTKYSTKWFNQ